MKLQEDADLELAMDAFGVTNNVPVLRTSEIDALSPSSKDDFTELHKLLKDKLSQYESSVHYSSFLESLFHDLCISLEVDDLKKIRTETGEACDSGPARTPPTPSSHLVLLLS
ncbi:hypothetical protein AAFF_G00436990 [Aldrovandia affinis]|uniref:Eukaryotic translation initiation factor 3 30 kDa subunit n=1 Tax=Aldrovandia affinis TaxID=143900 RepID=A0AAD7R377_9TELE|nr:hypothetical protein AAFF_G00436990 [Aldrovandia affinis]